MAIILSMVGFLPHDNHMECANTFVPSGSYNGYTEDVCKSFVDRNANIFIPSNSSKRDNINITLRNLDAQITYNFRRGESIYIIQPAPEYPIHVTL